MLMESLLSFLVCSRVISWWRRDVVSFYLSWNLSIVIYYCRLGLCHVLGMGYSLYSFYWVIVALLPPMLYTLRYCIYCWLLYSWCYWLVELFARFKSAMSPTLLAFSTFKKDRALHYGFMKPNLIYLCLKLQSTIRLIFCRYWLSPRMSKDRPWVENALLLVSWTRIWYVPLLLQKYAMRGFLS